MERMSFLAFSLTGSRGGGLVETLRYRRWIPGEALLEEIGSEVGSNRST